jgi:hypothetical protein
MNTSNKLPNHKIDNNFIYFKYNGKTIKAPIVNKNGILYLKYNGKTTKIKEVS